MEYAEIARATTSRGEVVLRSRQEQTGLVLELRVNGVFVMDTQETTTEQALATTALELVEDPRNVLVGGLGMGYTAHALLGDVRVERVDVVEIEGALITWMRDGTVAHGPSLLADQRIRIVEADIATAVQEVHEPTYDLVLLDVDNGPGQLVHQQNAQVYETAFLEHCRDILSPGGILVIWSADRDRRLGDRLRQVFGGCLERSFPVVLQQRETEYWLYATGPARGSDTVEA
jgi:spermidine synthase